jgi:hypothetical protein
MCTVSVIPLPTGGFRVACNRDESRVRAEGLPPVVTWSAGVRAVMPIDPAGGGTWIAATDRGIVLALLNYNPDSRALSADGTGISTFPASRGSIIPSLTDCRDVPEIETRVTALQPERFGPFRLFVIGPGGRTEFVSDRRTIARRRLPEAAGVALLLTSSGLGDALVEPPRRELFQHILESDPTAQRQDEFHRHSWPDRRQLSVCMSRDDARTVSYTTVEVTATCAVMRYWPAPPDAIGTVPVTVRRIPLAGPGGPLVPAGCP